MSDEAFLIIALVVIGPGRLPDVGAALGKSIRESDDQDDDELRRSDVRHWLSDSTSMWCRAQGGRARWLG